MIDTYIFRKEFTMNHPINICPDFFWLGALDPDLRVFDVVMKKITMQLLLGEH